MYCLSHMCHVCLEKKDKSLMHINNSSVNKEMFHIIHYPPFNLGWLKTKEIILICEECWLHLHRTYQFLTMCRKNGTLMQSFIHNKTNTEAISNTDHEAELLVNVNNIQDGIQAIKSEIKLEDEEIYKLEKEPIIEETDDVFINVEDFFVKEEVILKREEVDDKEDSSLVNNFTENSDHEMDSEISVNSNTDGTDNTHIKHSSVVIPENKTSTVVGIIGEQNLPYQCNVCNISFHTKQELNCHTIFAEHVTKRFCNYCKKSVDIAEFDAHSKQHENAEIFCCEYCGEIIYKLETFIRHKRKHIRLKCQLCAMQFDTMSLLKLHLKVHTDIKRDECLHCNRKFPRPDALFAHLADGTCLQPTGKRIYQCTICMKIFYSEKKSMQHEAQHKRYKCTLCNTIFSSEKCCEEHVQLVHGIIVSASN